MPTKISPRLKHLVLRKWCKHKQAVYCRLMPFVLPKYSYFASGSCLYLHHHQSLSEHGLNSSYHFVQLVQWQAVPLLQVQTEKLLDVWLVLLKETKIQIKESISSLVIQGLHCKWKFSNIFSVFIQWPSSYKSICKENSMLKLTRTLTLFWGFSLLSGLLLTLNVSSFQLRYCIRLAFSILYSLTFMEQND